MEFSPFWKRDSYIQGKVLQKDEKLWASLQTSHEKFGQEKNNFSERTRAQLERLNISELAGEGAWDEANASMQSFFERTREEIGSTQGALKSFKASIKGLGASMLSMGVNMLASWAVGAVIDVAYKAIDNYVHRSEKAAAALAEMRESWDEMSKSNEKAKDVVEKYGNEYERLRKGVNTYTNENVSLTDSEYERYLEMVNAIAGTDLNVSGSLDQNGNAKTNVLQKWKQTEQISKKSDA